MGFIQDLKQARQAAGDPGVRGRKRWSQGLQAGGDASVAAALDLITTFAQGKIPQALLRKPYSPGAKEVCVDLGEVVQAAKPTTIPDALPPSSVRVNVVRQR